MTIRMRGNYVFDSLECKKLKGLGINDYGDVWYVDSVNGGSGKSGKSWDQPKATITQAYALAQAGDVIACIGAFSEAIVSAKDNLSFIGCGNSEYETRWTGANDAKCLTLHQSNLVQGFRFQAPAYAADRAACAIALSGSNYAIIRGNRFQGKTGSQAAIYSAVADSDNVLIEDNEFIYHNTATYGAAIKGVEAGGQTYGSWKIRRNTFKSCVTAIDIAARIAEIVDNIIYEYGVKADATIAQVLALGIDLSGTSSGGNVVSRNVLKGAYTTTLYKVGASGDDWTGNFVPETATTAPNGLSIRNPA